MSVRFPSCLGEWKKLRTSSIWLPMAVAPVMTIAMGVLLPAMDGGRLSWDLLYGALVPVYALILLPLLVGIVASLVCRIEHQGGGWQHLLILPVRRTTIYAVKFIEILGILAVIQGLGLGGLLASGLGFLHLHGSIPWTMVIGGFLGGWMATIPLAALQLWVSAWWTTFASPFALSVLFTIPAIAMGGTPSYATWYPWTQPLWAMLPHGGIDLGTSVHLLTIALTAMAFLVGGWWHFVRRDIPA